MYTEKIIILQSYFVPLKNKRYNQREKVVQITTCRHVTFFFLKKKKEEKNKKSYTIQHLRMKLTIL